MTFSVCEIYRSIRSAILLFFSSALSHYCLFSTCPDLSRTRVLSPDPIFAPYFSNLIDPNYIHTRRTRVV